MRNIGIDPNNHLFYEGESNFGRGVSPMPTLLLATILENPPTIESIPESNELIYARLLFREDSFEATTRIRRGRLYKFVAGSQPHQWQVQRHPASPQESTMGASSFAKLLCGFSATNEVQAIAAAGRESLVALGPRAAYTLWRILSVERIVTGEDLVTLKARSSLGVIPEINQGAVPPGELAKVAEVLEAVAQAAHTSGPASVIDRARDACQWCLGVWLARSENDRKWLTEDLGSIARALESKKSLSSATARSVARLHSRAKPNESERYASRAVTEGDSEFALAAVGLILRDIEWAI